MERETLRLTEHTEKDRAGVDRMLASKQKRKFHMTDRMMQFFAYEHLPDRLQKISKPFGQLAEEICLNLPSNPERTVALRKLLEAKDCAVRAFLYKEPGQGGKETINQI